MHYILYTLVFISLIVQHYSSKQVRSTLLDSSRSARERSSSIIEAISDRASSGNTVVSEIWANRPKFKYLDILQETAKFPSFMEDMKNFTSIYWIDPNGNLTSGFISLRTNNNNFVGCDTNDNLGAFRNSITREELFVPVSVEGKMYLKSFSSGGFLGSNFNGDISCDYTKRDMNKIRVKHFKDDNNLKTYVTLKTPDGAFVSFAESTAVYTSDDHTEDSLLYSPFN
jgi:hypothetical protein